MGQYSCGVSGYFGGDRGGFGGGCGGHGGEIKGTRGWSPLLAPHRSMLAIMITS